MKCLGKDRVGFLSGYEFWQEDEYFKEELEHSKCVRKYPRSAYVRMIFIFCGALILLFSLLLASEGVHNIEKTIGSIEKTMLELQDILNESFAITSSLVQIGSNTGYIRDTVIERVKNFCPGAAGSGNLISVIDTENLIIQLDELAEFIVSGTTDLRSTLQRIIPVIDDILFNVQKWTDLGFIPLFPMLPYVIFSSLFIVGVTMAWLDFSHSSFERFQTWFVLPIFCITTALYWVLLCIIFCVAMLASDLCMGGDEMRRGPEMTLQEFLLERNLFEENLLTEILVYFTVGCTSDNPFEFIDVYEGDLNVAISTLQITQAQIDAVGVGYLSQICKQDVSELVNVLSPMQDNLVELLQIFGRSLSLFSCQRINEMYVNTFHIGLCEYSINAISWIFVSLLVIAICGMVLITLRASWLIVKHEKDEEMGSMRLTSDIELSCSDEKNSQNNSRYDGKEREFESISYVSLSQEEELFPSCKRKCSSNSLERVESAYSSEWGSVFSEDGDFDMESVSSDEKKNSEINSNDDIISNQESIIGESDSFQEKFHIDEEAVTPTNQKTIGMDKDVRIISKSDSNCFAIVLYKENPSIFVSWFKQNT